VQAEERERRAQAVPVILVTHNSELMESMCQRALWLDHGMTKMLGPADEVAAAYHPSTL
jgi:ABC-type polysaccharide/polyol phosphate transport system ATPase subunit